MLFSALSILSFLLATITAQYSDDFVRNTMWPLAAGAYITNQQECITSGTGDGKLKRKIDVSCDILNETCSAYTASSDSKKALILAWRGSQVNLEVPMEMLDILFGKQLIFPGGGKVADFFYNAMLKLWNNGVKDDFFTLRQQYPDYDVWVTGHSLGAAMASLSAGYLVQLGLVPIEKIKLVTFGQPRTGDSKYAAFMDTIYYQNNMTVGMPYITCNGNEDKKCSEGVPITNIIFWDHMTYYGVDILPYFERGCTY